MRRRLAEIERSSRCDKFQARLLGAKKEYKMDSLMEQLSQTESLEEQLRQVIFGLAFLIFMVYEFAVFFRYLWRRWREEKHVPPAKVD